MLRNRFTQLSFLLLLSAVTTVAIAGPPPGKGGGGRGKKNASLTVTVTPDSFSESDAGATPAATGTVTRENSDISGPLTVTLESSDISEATVPGSMEIPGSVEIPAGQASKTFDVFAVDDTDEDGDQSVTISVSATDHSGASTSITVTDDDTVNVAYRVRFAPIPQNASSLFLYDINEMGYAVGSYLIPDPDRDIGSRRVGFLYDAVNDDYWTSDQMITLGPEWVDVSFVGINNFGAIVGSIENLSRDIKVGILIYPNGSGWSYEILPSPEFANRSWARKINDYGDIVGTYYVETPWPEDEGANSGAFAINTGLYDATLSLPLTEFQIPVRVWPILSNARIGVVGNLDGSFGFDFRTGSVSPIQRPSEDYYINSISNDGQFSAYEYLYFYTPAVFKDGVLLWKADFEGIPRGVNSAVDGNEIGDVIVDERMRHADRGLIDIDDMVVFDDADDIALWFSAPAFVQHISDRVGLTSFGYLGGKKNGVPFVLIPEVQP